MNKLFLLFAVFSLQITLAQSTFHEEGRVTENIVFSKFNPHPCKDKTRTSKLICEREQMAKLYREINTLSDLPVLIANYTLEYLELYQKALLDRFDLLQIMIIEYRDRSIFAEEDKRDYSFDAWLAKFFESSEEQKKQNENNKTVSIILDLEAAKKFTLKVSKARQELDQIIASNYQLLIAMNKKKSAEKSTPEKPIVTKVLAKEPEVTNSDCDAYKTLKFIDGVEQPWDENQGYDIFLSKRYLGHIHGRKINTFYLESRFAKCGYEKEITPEVKPKKPVLTQPVKNDELQCQNIVTPTMISIHIKDGEFKTFCKMEIECQKNHEVIESLSGAFLCPAKNNACPSALECSIDKGETAQKLLTL